MQIFKNVVPKFNNWALAGQTSNFVWLAEKEKEDGCFDRIFFLNFLLGQGHCCG